MAKYEDFDDGPQDMDLGNLNIPLKKKNSSKHKSKNWILAIVIVLEIVIIAGLLSVLYVIKKVNLIQTTPLNEEKVVTNPDIKEDTQKVLKGYTNILLLGSDNRESGISAIDNNTDAILIASINNDTGEVKIISVYRDCLLEQEAYSETGEDGDMVILKATDAAQVGIENTLSMINRNLDMDIKDYIMLNWSALIELVDAVGGVDLEINLMEQRWTNRYLVDTSENTGVSYTNIVAIEDNGMSDEELRSNTELMNTKVKVHMDGIQATAFARVRFGDGLADYGRTRRQRDVITQIVAKAKSMSIKNLNNIVTAVAKNILTSLETDEILSMLPDLVSYKLTMIDGGFPFEKNDQISSRENWGSDLTDPIIPVTLESNVIEFHKLMFDDETYTPSDTVKEISEKIIDFTGVSE